LLANVPLTDADRAKILKGELVTTTAPESSEHELVAVIVFLTKRSPRDVVGVFRAQRFKKDPQVTAFGRIKGDGSLGDFKGVALKPNTVQAVQEYLNAKPGAELNLSAARAESHACRTAIPAGRNPK